MFFFSQTTKKNCLREKNYSFFKKKKANSSLEASKSVTSTSKRDINTANKKTWKVSDIAKMKPAEFAKNEKEHPKKMTQCFQSFWGQNLTLCL